MTEDLGILLLYLINVSFFNLVPRKCWIYFEHYFRAFKQVHIQKCAQVMESCPYIHGQTQTAVYPSPLPPPSLIPKLIPCCRIGESPSSPFPALPDGSVWIERRHTKEKKGNKEQECNRALLSFQTRTWLSVIFNFWKRLSFCLLEFRNVSKILSCFSTWVYKSVYHDRRRRVNHTLWHREGLVSLYFSPAHVDSLGHISQVERISPGAGAKENGSNNRLEQQIA